MIPLPLQSTGGLLPAWLPTEALLIGVLAMLAAVLVMNRGNPKFVVIPAQDEPVLVGAGAFVLAWGATVDLPVLVAIGTGSVALGLVSRYTDIININGLI